MPLKTPKSVEWMNKRLAPQTIKTKGTASSAVRTYFLTDAELEYYRALPPDPYYDKKDRAQKLNLFALN